MTSPLVYASIALYAASFCLYAWFLYENRRWIGYLATLSLAGGIACHYVALLARSHSVHSVPYDDLYGSMSLFAWFLAVSYLGIETLHRQRSVGAFVLPLLIIWLVLALLVSPATPPPAPRARGPLFAFHVTLNILAYAAFGLSFIFSLIYLLQNRVLRARHPGRTFWRFPALESLERMSQSSVWLGLIALVFGAIFGLVWQHRLSGHYAARDAKVIVTLAIIILYAGYLWLARSAAWRGARAALVCACNFLLVIFSYTLVNFYLTRFHRYF